MLLYSVDYPDGAENRLAKQAMRLGEPISDRILNAPDLVMGNELYLTAFNELDRERNHSNGLTRIPTSRVIEWGKYYSLDFEEIEFLKFVISKMDRALIDKLATKIKSSEPKTNGRKLTKPSR